VSPFSGLYLCLSYRISFVAPYFRLYLCRCLEIDAPSRNWYFTCVALLDPNVKPDSIPVSGPQGNENEQGLRLFS
jgi:hypothetical protein